MCCASAMEQEQMQVASKNSQERIGEPMAAQ
jgi:hypothetical protein